MLLIQNATLTSSPLQKFKNNVLTCETHHQGEENEATPANGKEVGSRSSNSDNIVWGVCSLCIFYSVLKEEIEYYLILKYN